ncbi:hypothetical protein RJT34_12484 [Clitoria ternatea]|uniref:HIRAN domain-containing protein n=1 Tax=Clitoria ternatea TaxID=43366 RepID=A0AAN9JNV1_CLITE
MRESKLEGPIEMGRSQNLIFLCWVEDGFDLFGGKKMGFLKCLVCMQLTSTACRMVGRRIPTAQDLCSRLICQPLNPDDPTAIKVLNSATSLIGYIERPIVFVLSSLIDTLLDIVEAIILSGTSHLPSSVHQFPIKIHLFIHRS